MKKVFAIVVVLLLGGILWQAGQHGDRRSAQAPAAVPDPEIGSPQAKPALAPARDEAAIAAAVKAPDFRFERLADGRSLVTESVKTARGLHAAGAPSEADLEAIEAIFGLYRWAYREVPEGGDNRELVAALTGQNPRKLVFIPADHPSLSATGELLDRWGTPYFFHKLSDQIIDVTSAGPDRRLWSRDDLSLGHTDHYQSAASKP